MPHLQLKNIHYKLPSQPILTNISLEFQDPKLVGIIGANGSGKSTLIQLLMGLIDPSHGRRTLNNREYQNLSPQEKAHLITLLAPQWELKPHIRVQEIFETFSQSYQPVILNNYIEELKIKPLIKKYFDQLSLGEQSRVLLARTLALQSPILLLDEPFANLDLEQEDLFWRILQREAKDRLVIIASHNLTFCAHYSTELILLQSGTIIAKGSPATIFTEENLNLAWQTSRYRLESQGNRPSYLWLDHVVQH